MGKVWIAWISLLVCMGATAFAEDNPQPSQEDMMAKWMENCGPQDQHRMLGRRAGEWDCTIKMWMGKDGPAQESHVTSTEVAVNGGRAMRESVMGTMMGMPFEAHGMTGYDNLNGVYWATWTDNFCTNMIYMEGMSGDGGKTVTFETTMDDPMTGEKAKPVRYVATWIDDSVRTFDIWHEIGTDKEYKMMEVRYTRKK